MPNLLRWFVDLAREMDRGMSVMRGKPVSRESREAEVLAMDSGVLVRMDLAGIEPGDVDLTFSNRGTLTVSGIIRPASDGEKVYNLEDLDLKPFRKVVNLPSGYEDGEARAAVKGQTLEVFIEKSELEAETRQLRIDKN